jgi:type IV secretion system protein TrbL
MKMSLRGLVTVVLAILLCFLFHPTCVTAQQANAPSITNISQAFQQAAGNWRATIQRYASWLFWTLVAISMAWTFGMMALRKADLQEFAAEFIRFTIFTGFFWWLLTNGPHFANTILNSLQNIAAQASGFTENVDTGHLVWMGFSLVVNALKNLSLTDPSSWLGVVLAGIILLIFLLIAGNMLVLLCAGYVLAYAGAFFLGFGGCRWTSEMAIGYYRKILEVAASLMVMILVMGLGQSFLNTYWGYVSNGLQFDSSVIVPLDAMFVFFGASVILLLLVAKLPPMVCSIISGTSIGHSGIGNWGAGSLLVAGGMAMSAGAMGINMTGAGIGNTYGGYQALMEACRQGQDSPVSMSQSMGQGPGGDSNPGSGMGPLTRAIMPPVRGAVAVTSALAKGVGGMAGNAIKERAGRTFPGKLAKSIQDKSASGSAGSIGPGEKQGEKDPIRAFIDGDHQKGWFNS